MKAPEWNERIAAHERRTEEKIDKFILGILAKFEETTGLQNKKILEQKKKAAE